MLKEIIEKSLTEENRVNYGRDYFYASQIAEPCDAKLFYEINGGEKDKLEANSKLTFMQGDEIHRTIMECLYKSREVDVVCAEADIEDNELVHGRADCIFSPRGSDQNYVVDIKSASHYSFKSVKSDGPREKHVLQVQVYLYFFDIDHGLLLYYDKDKQELAEFEVKRDDQRVEDKLARLKKLKDEFDELEEPPEPDKSDWEWERCQYCDYSGICPYS